VFKALTRIILILIVVGGLIWFFAPRIIDNASNSLLSATNSSLSQVQGLAQFIPSSVTEQNKGSGDLQVQLSGLEPNTVYDVTLDQSQCSTISKDLGTITADGSGGVYIVFTVGSLDNNQGWYVDVHQQNSLGETVACGQLETNKTSDAQVINSTQDGPGVFSGQAESPTPTTQSQSVTSESNSNPVAGSTTTPATPPQGLPDTGANPGNNQNYDNNQYPRKY
jgi:hypothetical protein